MAKKVERAYGLTNSFSGTVGEMAVAAHLVRCGLRVAKPYWSDNEIDLLVFWQKGKDYIPVSVQVKSVQLASSINSEKHIQGLKKKYIENNKYLCLAIYSPERNKIWLIDGADNIKSVQSDGVKASKGRKGVDRKAYSKIKVDEDVPIYVNLTNSGDSSFDSRWRVDNCNPKKTTDVFRVIAGKVIKTKELKNILQYLFKEEHE